MILDLVWLLSLPNKKVKLQINIGKQTVQFLKVTNIIGSSTAFLHSGLTI